MCNMHMCVGWAPSKISPVLVFRMCTRGHAHVLWLATVEDQPVRQSDARDGGDGREPIRPGDRGVVDRACTSFVNKKGARPEACTSTWYVHARTTHDDLKLSEIITGGYDDKKLPRSHWYVPFPFPSSSLPPSSFLLPHSPNSSDACRGGLSTI